MTNYTKTTDFAAKDSLPSGNAAKIVKGSEIDTEFNNIATASATKANANNAALTGTTTAQTLDISGNVDVDGTLETDALSLNGVTVTSTAAELNILDGVTSTAAELNILDGVTATTAELNYVDGVTSNVQTQLNTKAPLASPTFTGTVTAAGLTVDTTTLVVDASNNRVGIGTASPYSALTVDTANGILNIANGNTSGGTKIQAWAATPANGYLAIEGYDKEYVRINASGNVGIGTSSPDTQLTLYKASTNADVDYAKMRMDSWGGSTGKLKSIVWDDAGNNVAAVGAEYDGSKTNIHFHSQYNGGFKGTSVRTMSIMGDGKVGIGTSSPSAKLTVVGTTKVGEGAASNTSKLMVNTASGTAAGIQLFQDSVESWIIDNPASSTGLTFSNSGTERMRIDGSGNVSVSSSAGLIENAVGVFMLPAGELRVKDSTEDGTAQISIYNNNVTSDAEQFFVGNNLADVDIGNKRGALKFFANSATERMRISTSGNLLVGTTAGSFGARITAQSTSSYTFESRRTGTGSEGHVVFRNANGAVGSIFTNGTATAYNTSSDQRLKENITDADDAGSKVDAIQVRKFDWIADGSHQDYGMVAQELQSVAPEAVSAPEDPDEMMGVDYSKLVPMLVKEIQTLRNRVAQLENN